MLDRLLTRPFGRVRLGAQLRLDIRPDRAAELCADKLHAIADAQHGQFASLRRGETPLVGLDPVPSRRRQILRQGTDQPALDPGAAGDQQAIDPLEYRRERHLFHRHRQNQGRAARPLDRLDIAPIEHLLAGGVEAAGDADQRAAHQTPALSLAK